MPEEYRTVLTPAGLKHPRVREFLDVKRHPASHGLAGALILEGTWMVRQALAASVRLQAVFVCPALLRGPEGRALARTAASRGAEGYEVSERVLSRMADRDGPDGIAALGRVRQRTPGGIRVDRRTRVIIADGWDLPGNLGTLIRCADGAGASAVLVVEQGFALSHPLVLKASMGAALAMPVIAIGRPAARRWLRERGFRILAADPPAAIPTGTLTTAARWPSSWEANGAALPGSGWPLPTALPPSPCWASPTPSMPPSPEPSCFTKHSRTTAIRP